MKTIKGNTIIEVLVSVLISSLCMIYGATFFVKNTKANHSLQKLNAFDTAVSIFNEGIDLSALPVNGTLGNFNYTIIEDADFDHAAASKVEIIVESSESKIKQRLTVFISK